jgi:two-component system NtrC family response regulator
LEIPDEGLSLEAVEQELIKKALAKANGNRSEAARLLRVPRHVLIYRLEKFKI